MTLIRSEYSNGPEEVDDPYGVIVERVPEEEHAASEYPVGIGVWADDKYAWTHLSIDEASQVVDALNAVIAGCES